MSRVLRALLLVVLAVALVPAGASAVSVNEVAKEVRCPTCNTPLDVSDAPVARDMKQYIALRIDEGWTKDEIIDGLVAEFGSEVLATPPKSGFDLVAWIGPGIAVAIGLLAILVLTRLWARRSRAQALPAAPTAEEAARLEDELRRFRG